MQPGSAPHAPPVFGSTPPNPLQLGLGQPIVTYTNTSCKLLIEPRGQRRTEEGYWN